MYRRAMTFYRLTAALGLLGLALLVAPTAVAGDPCYHGFDLPARTVGTDPQIKVAPCAFAPTVTRVPVGGTVTFFNGDGPAHLITGANQEWGSRDVELRPNATVSYTFEKAGTYPYACALHRGMSGAIVVGDPDTALAVTDEGGNTAPALTAATASGGAGSSSGAEMNDYLPALAIASAAGVLAGVTIMMLVMRRQATVRP